VNLLGHDDGPRFDHDLPFSLGGTSISTAMCSFSARHNLEKRDRMIFDGCCV